MRAGRGKMEGERQVRDEDDKTRERVGERIR